MGFTLLDVDKEIEKRKKILNLKKCGIKAVKNIV